MTRAASPDKHPPVAHGKIGLLLLNLGTPDGTGYWAMRRYLSEFLSDRRIIELPQLLWQPLLQLVILSRRPFISGRNYQKIWNSAADESPLRTITRAQAAALASRFADDDRLIVDWAMRYGTPDIAGKVQSLQEKGCDRILLAALYPQYSAATTASAYDAAFAALQKLRWQPAIRTLPAYYDTPAYIEALFSSIQQQLGSLSWQPEHLLCSFHGLPEENLAKGDPYYCHCHKTARLLQERLQRAGLIKDASQFSMVFQSRFGPKEWLKPYADKKIAELASSGVKKIAILSPGFAADCIETLEEVAIGFEEIFYGAGGEKFHYIPCLNESAASIDLLEGLLRQQLMGWL